MGVISIGFPHGLRLCSRHSSSALEALRRGTRPRPRATLRTKHVSAALRDVEAPGDFDKPHSLFSLSTWERGEFGSVILEFFTTQCPQACFSIGTCCASTIVAQN